MASEYKIVRQSQAQELSPAGTGFEQVWNITYQVTSGPARDTQGTLTVSEADHNAAYVGKAIEAKIAALSSVASLGSPGSA